MNNYQEDFEKLVAEANSKLKYYEVVSTDRVIAEDGTYDEGDFVGYGIENLITGVIEHTTVCLPAAMYQAVHFDEMLTSLVSAETPKLSLVTPTEDIVPH